MLTYADSVRNRLRNCHDLQMPVEEKTEAIPDRAWHIWQSCRHEKYL